MTVDRKRRPPGPKLIVDPALLRWSPEVNELIARVHQILRTSGVTLTALAKIQKTSKQNVERDLHTDQPHWHVVEGAVAHCVEVAEDQERHGWITEVRRLWENAQGTSPSATTPAPDAGALTDDGSLPGLLGLVLEGRYHIVAGQLAAGPHDAAAVGQALWEIGSRSPGAAAAVIQAAVDQEGQELADAWMEALTGCDEKVAAAVGRHLPPPPPPEPETPPEPEPEPIVSLTDLAPAAFEGRRLALLVRRGEQVLAATDILLQATPEPPTADSNSSGRGGTDLSRAYTDIWLGHERVNVTTATALILSLRQGDGEDPRTLAAVLSELAHRGHTELAAVVLQNLGQDNDAFATAVLQDIPRTRASAVLQASTTRTLHMRDGITEELLAWVPVPVAADFLLAAAHDSAGAEQSAALLTGLPRRTRVLHHMAAGQPQNTARIFNAVTAEWNLNDAGAPERRIAESFLQIARADHHIAAGVLLQFLRFNARSAADLLFLMETAFADRDAAEVAAGTLTAVLDTDPPTAAVLIARMAGKEDFPIRLLDAATRHNPAHGTLIVTQMLIQSLAYFRSQIPAMLRQDATTLTAELLRQLSDREPEAPWPLIHQALTNGAPAAALDNADAYIAGL